MDQNKTEIIICLGSSCFARGNKKMVQVVQQFLKQNHLEEKVFFHGAHCFNQCGEGPVIKIGDRVLRSADEDEVRMNLKEYFNL
jgi:NADH:ubiquinone oxidoreductase subunit E